MALALAPVFAPVDGHAAEAAQAMEFRIWRKGEDIGRHHLLFERRNDGLSVTSRVDIKVKVAFITAFSFEQEADDLWRDHLLVRSRVRTDDDGERSLIEIEAGAESVTIEGPKGLLEAPKGIMTDVCFWNHDITGQSRLLDTGKGEFHPLESVLLGEENVDVAGGSRLAKRYRMESKGGRSGDIWFDSSGEWVNARLTTRGETLDYERIG